jgi:hypothetical protein
MKLVYIAGPFTGPTAWDVEENVRRAERVALEVACMGAMPVCPHTNTRFFHGQLTEEFWNEGTMEILKRCDAVMLVPGWSASKHALLEHACALARGVPAFSHERPEEFVRWIMAGETR